MKKLFTLLALCTLTLGAWAQTQNIYEWKDNSVTIRTTESFDSLTFALPAEAFVFSTGDPSDLTEKSMSATFELTSSLSISNASSTTEQGVCYSSEETEPTMDCSRVSRGTMYTGSWMARLTGLCSGTQYYYRPYLRIADAVFYGEVKSFTTLNEDVEDEPSVYTVNGVSFTMISVEGGTFTMGSPYSDSDAWDNEKPAHQVTLSSFAIGETEVTQELWQAVMGSNPSYFTGDLQCPVECVSWNDCQTFITKLNELTGATFRLPTEAEWEYAARGGNASEGYKYSGSNTIGDVAWYWENSSDATKAVKTKQPNELGIYDMSGNVSEWCADWYNSSYYASSPENNPTGPSSGSSRVLRGGCWSGFAEWCRVAIRDYFYPDLRNNNLGLRLVL